MKGTKPELVGFLLGENVFQIYNHMQLNGDKDVLYAEKIPRRYERFFRKRRKNT